MVTKSTIVGGIVFLSFALGGPILHFGGAISLTSGLAAAATTRFIASRYIFHEHKWREGAMEKLNKVKEWAKEKGVEFEREGEIDSLYREYADKKDFANTKRIRDIIKKKVGEGAKVIDIDSFLGIGLGGIWSVRVNEKKIITADEIKQELAKENVGGKQKLT